MSELKKRVEGLVSEIESLIQKYDRHADINKCRLVIHPSVFLVLHELEQTIVVTLGTKMKYYFMSSVCPLEIHADPSCPPGHLYILTPQERDGHAV